MRVVNFSVHVTQIRKTIRTPMLCLLFKNCTLNTFFFWIQKIESENRTPLNNMLPFVCENMFLSRKHHPTDIASSVGMEPTILKNWKIFFLLIIRVRLHVEEEISKKLEIESENSVTGKVNKNRKLLFVGVIIDEAYLNICLAYLYGNDDGMNIIENYINTSRIRHTERRYICFRFTGNVHVHGQLIINLWFVNIKSKRRFVTFNIPDKNLCLFTI